MRQFARPFPLERLSLEARVLYTAFLVFLGAGLASSVWLYASSFGGLRADAAATYYLGDAADAPAPDPGDGRDAAVPAIDKADDAGRWPALELPEEAAGSPIRLGQSPRQVMETFHFHLFTVPVVLLIVGHLFMLTSMGTRRKVAIISVASLATFAHLVAPLAIRFGGEGFGWLMPSSVAVASLGWLPMVVVPLWEMWRRLPARSEAPATGGSPR